MNEQKVTGRNKTTKTRVRISDLSDASTPEYDTEVSTLPHYIQRNHLPSIKRLVCNIKCGYIDLNLVQSVSYVTGLQNRNKLFSAVCLYFPLVLLFFHAVFSLFLGVLFASYSVTLYTINN
jgi:hypothetical protein